MEHRIAPEGYHRFYKAIDRAEGEFGTARDQACNKDESSTLCLMFDDFNKIFNFGRFTRD